MTIQTLARAIRSARQTQKPTVIKESGRPRYVVLEWEEYQELRDIRDEYLDELEDEREANNPEVQEIIREGMKEYRAGKSRPAEKLLTELNAVRDRSRKGGYRAKRRSA